jgi:hypothetical protein
MRASDKLWLDLAPLRKLSAARLRAWRDLLQLRDAPWLSLLWEQRWIAGQSEAYTVSAALRPALVLRCEKCERESFAGFTEEMEEQALSFESIAKSLERKAVESLIKRSCQCALPLTKDDPEAFDVSVAMILLETPDIG